MFLKLYITINASLVEAQKKTGAGFSPDILLIPSIDNLFIGNILPLKSSRTLETA
jgi:hypothetical protein